MADKAELTLYLTHPTTGAVEALNPGCCIDGHWGQYGTSRLLRIADELLGTTLWDECRSTMLENGEDVEGVMTDELPGGSDEITWSADNAEELLNAATTGGYWGWYDGEFYLTQTYVCDLCEETIESDGDGGYYMSADELDDECHHKARGVFAIGEAVNVTTDPDYADLRFVVANITDGDDLDLSYGGRIVVSVSPTDVRHTV